MYSKPAKNEEINAHIQEPLTVWPGGPAQICDRLSIGRIEVPVSSHCERSLSLMSNRRSSLLLPALSVAAGQNIYA